MLFGSPCCCVCVTGCSLLCYLCNKLLSSACSLARTGPAAVKLSTVIQVHKAQINLQVSFETLSQFSQSNGVRCLCLSDGESCDHKSPLGLCLVTCSLGLLEKCFYIFECRKWTGFGLNSNLAYFLPSLEVIWS